MDPKNPYRSPLSDLTPPVGGVDTTNPFDPKGRFTRLSWLAWNLVVGLAIGLAAIPLFMLAGTAGIAGMAASPDAAPAMPIFMIVGVVVIDILFLIVYILFAIRRFHDMDASGWWSATLIVPLANLIAVLVLLFKRGTVGANRFGPPRPTPGWETVVGYISIVLMVLSLVGVIVAVAIPTYMAYQQGVPMTP
jgi:uncharacterized membrane protein YhaH (DUF805 family)